jgi:tetratricopeptide (TPR) repeat protein
VAGSLTPLGDALALTLTLIDPRGPRQLGAVEFSVPRDEILQLRSQAMSRLVDLLKLRLGDDPGDSPQASEQPSAAAFAAYLTGLGTLQHLDRLTDAAQLARVDSALTSFGHAIAREPHFAAALAGRAEACWRRYTLTREEEWSTAALDACEHALEVEPRLAEGLRTRGSIHAGRGEYERALVDFRAALAHDSLDVLAQRGLAETFTALGDTARAEATYLRALASRPSDLVTRKQLGVFYYHEGRFADAVRQFRALIDAAPRNPFLGWNQLGGIYFQEGRLDSARVAFERSLAIAPNYRAHTNLAAVDYREGHYAAAVEGLRSALAIHDYDYRVWGNLASTLMRLPGRREEAMEAYARAAELAEARLHVNPRDVRVMCILAGYDVELDAPGRALELLTDARRFGGLDAESLYQSGHSYERLGHREEALACLAEALERGLSPRRIEQAPTLTALRQDRRWPLLAAGAARDD